ncbi:MAG TPA: tetratricopeptide repeat protein [Caulobacteraceae bacterium]|nr:tetratricopeptide repeat protein [Caulobacteraceae bacterium]
MSLRRSAQTSVSSAALGFPEAQIDPARARTSAGVTGDAASPNALQRLNEAVGDLRALAIAPLLRHAVTAIGAEKAERASKLCLEALEIDDRCGMAWYLLAIAREKAGDFKSSLQAYEAALALLPDQAEVANDLGRLAYRLGMKDVAVQLFQHFMARYPDSHEGANNLACAVRDVGRYGEAIEILRTAINANPGEALLWNTLGTVLSEQGDLETAITFFTEALRLDPEFNKARYNRGNALMARGDLDEALVDCEGAIARVVAPDERAMMTLARSTLRIARGEIGLGWDDYEARIDPDFADVTHFMIERPKWTPDADLAGKRFLLMGEQGLGDEILFANLIPDLVEALGPGGHLSIAVEKRLIPLFRRSFPAAKVGAHATYKVDGHTVRGAPFVQDFEAIDLWAPMASPLRRFRRTLDAFPDRPGYLKADPERIAYWKTVLETQAPAGPKVGLLWKSMKNDGARTRYFSPFAQWEAVLKTPGISFVNMQYGDCTEEIARARDEFGVEIWQPPEIDLKDELDEVAALSCALDLTVGFANATSNIAAACGAPTWIISVPGAWTRLGTDRMPWYPQARIFTPEGFGQWDVIMGEVAEALAAHPF